MDMLGGYGSGSDVESDSERNDGGARARAPTASGTASEAVPPGPAAASAPALASLPKPTTSGVDLSAAATGLLTGAGGLRSAPPPSATTKKLVKLPLPLQAQLLAAGVDSDGDDDVPAAKRAKPSGKKMNLMDFLPPPRNDLGSSGLARPKPLAKGLQAADSTSQQPPATTAGAARGEQQQLPSDFFEGGAAYSNEAFRVPGPADDGEPASASGYAAYGSTYQYGAQDYGQYDEAAYAQYYAQVHHSGVEAGAGAGPPKAGPSGRRSAAAAAAAGGGDGNAELSAQELLDTAMRAEQERAAKRGGAGGKGGGGGDVKFVEINAKDLTKMDPAERVAAKGVQEALGAGYAAALRSSAQAFQGDKMARRKHQIGTLYHNAKVRELEVLEKQGQGMKTKAETAAKYGW